MPRAHVLSVEGPKPNTYTLANGDEVEFDTRLFNGNNGSAHLVLTRGNMRQPGTMVRMASECSMGHPIGSVLCECGTQLRMAMTQLARADSSAMVYSFGAGFEGRGVGPIDHFRAYVLHTKKRLSSPEAYRALGLAIDGRAYKEPVEILRHLGLHKQPIRVLTNNDKKLSPLRAAGFNVTREPLEAPVTVNNAPQIQSRFAGMAHEFSEKTRAAVHALNVQMLTVEEALGMDMDLRVEAEVLDGGHRRFGPVTLPLALDGRDEGEIRDCSVHLYDCGGRLYYVIQPLDARPEQPYHVSAVPACLPGDNFGSLRCNCHRQMRELMGGLKAGAQPSVVIYALEHHADRPKICLDSLRAHIFDDTHNREPIDIDTNQDAQFIIKSMGIRRLDTKEN